MLLLRVDTVASVDTVAAGDATTDSSVDGIVVADGEDVQATRLSTIAIAITKQNSFFIFLTPYIFNFPLYPLYLEGFIS